MSRKQLFTHHAMYPLLGFYIPCYWHEETEEISATHWLLDPFLDLAVYIDFEFNGIFRFWIGNRIEN